MTIKIRDMGKLTIVIVTGVKDKLIGVVTRILILNFEEILKFYSICLLSVVDLDRIS